MKYKHIKVDNVYGFKGDMFDRSDNYHAILIVNSKTDSEITITKCNLKTESNFRPASFFDQTITVEQFNTRGWKRLSLIKDKHEAIRLFMESKI